MSMKGARRFFFSLHVEPCPDLTVIELVVIIIDIVPNAGEGRDEKSVMEWLRWIVSG